QLARDEDDAHGPLAVGAAAEAGSARLVAVGSSSLAGNDGITFQGNLDFVVNAVNRSEEHTSELQSRENLVCRLPLEKKKKLVKTNERAPTAYPTNKLSVFATYLKCPHIVHRTEMKTAIS